MFHEKLSVSLNAHKQVVTLVANINYLLIKISETKLGRNFYLVKYKSWHFNFKEPKFKICLLTVLYETFNFL